jgi:hypothetical protein
MDEHGTNTGSPSFRKGFSKFLHDPRMEVAVNAKLNARAAGMDKGKSKKIVKQFLLDAHFTVAEVEQDSKKLEKHFNTVFSRRIKLVENQGEEYKQDHNKHWMKMFEVPYELVGEFPKITEKIREKEEEFATILNSQGSLKQ